MDLGKGRLPTLFSRSFWVNYFTLFVVSVDFCTSLCYLYFRGYKTSRLFAKHRFIGLYPVFPNTGYFYTRRILCDATFMTMLFLPLGPMAMGIFGLMAIILYVLCVSILTSYGLNSVVSNHHTPFYLLRVIRIVTSLRCMMSLKGVL